MYSSPEHAAQLQDEQEIRQMQQLLATDWQRTEDGQWLHPIDGKPYTFDQALQIAYITPFNAADWILRVDVSELTDADEAVVVDIGDE